MGLHVYHWALQILALSDTPKKHLIIYLFFFSPWLISWWLCSIVNVKGLLLLVLKWKTGKKELKTAVSKYCKVDIVQRHMADPRKLQGTEEFLCLSLLGLLHRSGDKGCSGSLGLANVCKQEEVPCPLDVLPIWRESCHRGVVTSVRRWPPPQPLAGTLRVQAHTGPHFLPRLRGTAQSLKDTDLRRGLHTCRQERGKWVDPGYVASECTLEMTLPPSCPHSTVTIPCGDRGNCSSSPRSPFLLF